MPQILIAAGIVLASFAVSIVGGLGSILIQEESKRNVETMLFGVLFTAVLMVVGCGAAYIFMINAHSIS